VAYQKAATRNGSDERHHSRLRERVDALLARIPAKDRILLVLKEVEGLSLRELEDVYGVESNVLKRRLFRARQRTLKTMQTA
jgi:RNA polymerase sigma-70 factor (ECF subfamily)